MIDLISEASTLGVLLEETRGVVGVVLGTRGGELRTVVGSFVDGDATAATAASLTEELDKVGSLLGLGELGVASLKAQSAARVFARRADAVLAIELDPKRPLGELETKLRTLDWAPVSLDPTVTLVNRAPTVSGRDLDDKLIPPPSPSEPAPASAPHSNGPSPTGIPPNALPIGSMRTRPSTTTPSPIPAALRPPGKPASSSAGAPTRPLGTSATPTRPGVAPTRPPTSPNRLARPSPVSLPAQVKSVGSGPVFTGDLEEFCLPDLLEFLRNSHRSGLLMCTTADGIGTVQLSRGMIISADSPNALDLREHLLASADIPLERRRGLAELPSESFTDDQIDTLVARDLIPPEEIERARVLRIYSAFREMIQWTVGRFSFDPGVAVVTNPGLALSAQTILMHLYQEQDEKVR